MDDREFHHLIKSAEEKLKSTGIESPTAEVEIILEYLLEVERLDLYLHGARIVDNNILRRFNQIIEKRITRYPLQYILGEAWFYGRRFAVAPAVMVPTPETEILCDLAINYIKNEGLETPAILDIGTGSGVIAVTVACQLPKAKIKALDISPDALNIARKNAESLGAADSIQFVQSNRFSALGQNEKFDLILSNPPYISEEEYKTLPPEVLADPKLALVSGKKGLDFIEVLLGESPKYLNAKGRLMFEIGFNQADEIAHLTEKDQCYRTISIIKDLNDIDRVVILSI